MLQPYALHIFCAPELWRSRFSWSVGEETEKRRSSSYEISGDAVMALLLGSINRLPGSDCELGAQKVS